MTAPVVVVAASTSRRVEKRMHSGKSRRPDPNAASLRPQGGDGADDVAAASSSAMAEGVREWPTRMETIQCGRWAVVPGGGLSAGGLSEGRWA